MSERSEEIVRQQCAASLKLVEAAAATCRSGLGPVRARPTLYDWALDADIAGDDCPPFGIPRPMRVVR